MAKIKQLLKYNIRLMQEIDIPQAMEIDREAFPTQWPHPTYTSFKQELRNRLAHYIVACKPVDSDEYAIPFVLSNNITFWTKLRNFFIREQNSTAILPPSREQIIGIAGFWLMMREAHITTIAVRKNLRRHGIGEQLLISTIDMAIKFNAQIVTLEVRTSNEDAQQLYQKYGFYKTGTRPRYYTDNGEDAFIMSTDTIDNIGFKASFDKLKHAYEQKWEHILNKEVHYG